MADIVNRVLKILLMKLLLDQLISTARSHNQQVEDIYRAWSDIIANDAAIFPDHPYKGSYENKRAIGTGTSRDEPQTSYESRRQDSLPSSSLLESNRNPRIATRQSQDVVPAARSEGESSIVGQKVSPETDASSLNNNLDDSKVIDNGPVDKTAPISILPKAVPVDQSGNPVSESPADVTKIDPCDPNPCQNGGTCRLEQTEEKAYQCACPLQYRGKYCHEAMTKCDVISCTDLTDCISAPSGAICICKGPETGRLCQLDVANQTEWEKLKTVVSERTVHTAEIIVGSVLSLLVLLVILLSIHCHRVNSRRAVVRKRYKEVLDKGIVPSEPPPDWCDISSDVIKQTLCCKTRSLVDDYKPRKSLSRTQSMSKQAEDELERLLNSRTNIPDSGSRIRRPPYSLLNETDKTLKADPDGQVSPQQIDLEINRRTSPYRNVGFNCSVTNNQYLNRQLPTLQSRIRLHGPEASLGRKLSEQSVSNSRGSTYYRPSQNKLKENCKTSLHEELLKRASQQTNRLNRQKSGPSSRTSITSGNKNNYRQERYEDVSDNNEYDQTSEPEYQSMYRYPNNSSRRKLIYDRSHNAYVNNDNRTNGKLGNLRSGNFCSNYRDEFEKKMEDIKGNLETLKSSISHKNSRRNTITNQHMKRCPESQSRNRRIRNVKYATRSIREELDEDSSSSDDEEAEIDEKIMRGVNIEHDISDDRYGTYEYSAHNRNFNTNTNYDCNGIDQGRMYYKNMLNYYEQLMGCPSTYSYKETSEILTENINHNENEENSYRQEPASFNGHLLDPSIQRDNIYWYWNREPGNSLLNMKMEDYLIVGTSKEQFKHEGHDSGSVCKYDGKTTSRSYNDLTDNEQDPHLELVATDHMKDEMEDILSHQGNEQSVKVQKCHVATEIENPLRLSGSECYGILATTVVVPPLEEYSQYVQQDNHSNDESQDKVIPTYLINKESFDRDISSERQFVKSFDNDGQKLYYVSNDLENCVVFSEQQPLDMDQENTQETSRVDTQNIEIEHSEHTSPSCLDASKTHVQPTSTNLENTPSTIVGTDNTTEISPSKLDEVTLVAESNGSDTEIEL